MTGLDDAIKDFVKQNRFLKILRYAGDYSPAAHWIKEFEGRGKPLRMLWISNRYTELYGIRRVEYEGHTDFDVWPEPIAQAFMQADHECLKSGDAGWLVERTDIGPQLVCKYPIHREDLNFVGVAGMAVPMTELQSIFCKGRHRL